MAITEAMKTRVRDLKQDMCYAKASVEACNNRLAELYTQFLKENGLDGYICHKANVGIGEQARAVLFVKKWDNGNIEIRYKLTNEVHDMDREYPACCRFTTDPVEVMQEILDNYIPYYSFKHQE